jgi:hypothetical protein
VGSGWLCGPTIWDLDRGEAVQELGPATGDGHLVDLCVGSEGWITAIGDQAYYFWADPGRAEPIILDRRVSRSSALPRMVGDKPVLVGRADAGITLLIFDPGNPSAPPTMRVLPTDTDLDWSGPGVGPSHAGNLAATDDLSLILSLDHLGLWHAWEGQAAPPARLETHAFLQTATALDAPRRRFAYGDSQPFVYLLSLP